jgi:RNA polymerase sigma factor (sigma-70 family)
MSDRGLRSALDRVLCLAAGPREDTTPDEALLRRFATEGDPEAFAVLVRRHGGMVLGVCRRLLADPNDAEDAFQATFLVLVRRAGAVRRGELLPGWLYGVARRVAGRARAVAQRRAARQRPLPEAAAPAAESVDPDLRAVLDEEVARLPEKYRLPVILCYLQDRTNDEAARLLGCPPGTVATRLARARDRLRSRVARRGLGPCAALPASAPLGDALAPAVCRAAAAFRAGQAPAPAVVGLVKGALHDMTMTRLKAWMAALLALAVTAAAATLRHQAVAQRPPAEPPKEARPAEKEKAAPAAWKEKAAFAVKAKVKRLAVSADGKLVATGADFDPIAIGPGPMLESPAKLWDAATGKKRLDLASAECQSNVGCVGFSPDGKTALCGMTELFLFDLATNRPRAKLNEVVTVQAAALSPDGTALAVLRADGFLRLYPLGDDGKPRPPRFTVRAHMIPGAVAFTADGKTVVSAGADGVRLLEAATGKARPAPRVPLNECDLPALSADGALVAAVDFNCGLRVWETATGKMVLRQQIPLQLIPQGLPALAPDGRAVAVGLSDGSVRVYELPGGRLHELKGHRSAVTAVAFSGDGQALAGGDQLGNVRIWAWEKKPESEGR